MRVLGFIGSMNRFALIIAAAAALASNVSFACPPVHNLEDVNCDGHIKFSVIGDSIGRGSRGNLRAAGSFVKRIGKSFRFAIIKNLSIPGLDTPHAIRDLQREFPSNDYGVRKSMLDKSDFVLIEVGLNDYFSSTNPNFTIRNLKTIVSLIRSYVHAHGGATPVVAISLITPVAPVNEFRRAEAAYVQQLNEAIIDARSDDLPAYVRFNTIPVSEIFRDGIHPDTNGHARMTKILTAYIRTALAPVTPTPTPTETPTPTPTS